MVKVYLDLERVVGMKLLILIVVALAGLYFYPQINEDTSSPCGALEKRYIRTAFSGSDGSKVLGALFTAGSGSGDLAASAVKTASPNLPAPIGCLKFYYQLMLDPDMAKSVFSDDKK